MPIQRSTRAFTRLLSAGAGQQIPLQAEIKRSGGLRRWSRDSRSVPNDSVALLATSIHESGQHPTFSDVIALVRRQLRPSVISSMSCQQSDIHKSADQVSSHLVELLCYA